LTICIDREREHHLLEVHRCVGQDRQHDSQEAVDADLRDDGGEDYEYGQRRGAVGVGHPSVQREHGRLDQERGGEHQEDPLLGALADGALLEDGERERDVAPLGRREHA
jgi:hypothetical protein